MIEPVLLNSQLEINVREIDLLLVRCLSVVFHRSLNAYAPSRRKVSLFRAVESQTS